MHLFTYLHFISLVIGVKGAIVFYDLVFTRKIASPDGYERSALVVNDELIGPTIEAFVGDEVIVNVTNLGEKLVLLFNFICNQVGNSCLTH